MARTINYIERISDDFQQLDTMTQADLVCELFVRLDYEAKQEAWRRVRFHASLAGIAPPVSKPARNGVGVCSFCNGTKVAYNTVDGQVVCPKCKGTGKAEMPALMTKEEVGQCGALALAEPEVKQ